jgi:hypothetical protein
MLVYLQAVKTKKMQTQHDTLPASALDQAHQEEQQITGINPVFAEALSYMRKTKAIGDALVASSTSLVPVLSEQMTQSESQRIAAERKTVTDKEAAREQDAQADRTVKEFMTALPHSVRNKGVRGKQIAPDSFNVPAGTMKDALLLESAIWWVPVDRYNNDTKPWNAFIHDMYAQASHLPPFPFENTPRAEGQRALVEPTRAPYVVIGQRMRLTEESEDGKDAHLELLLGSLVPGNPDQGYQAAPYLVMDVSSRCFDIAEELGMEHLGDKLTDPEDLKPYIAFNGGYRVANVVKSFAAPEIERFGNSYVNLTDEPRRESKKARYWNEVKQAIAARGIPSRLTSSHDRLNKEMFDTYNVAFHTLKLAVDFDKEAEYTRTVGRIPVAI